LDNLEPKTQNLIDRLEVFLSRTPLERFAAFFVANIPQNNSTFLGECAKNLFDSYNEFLGLLNDEQKRDDLEKLSLAEQDGSEVFAEARRIRHKFRLAMQDTFTGSQSPLRDHAIAKGIF
jgi:hypothetical protein